MIHIRHRHSEQFTVVGNHLAQHRDLSAVAIGLAVHIQSVPDGASVTAKALALRFSEGETTIRRGLNELERAGYLARPRVPLGGGRFATHTVAYDKPGAVVEPPRPGPEEAPVPEVRDLPRWPDSDPCADSDPYASPAPERGPEQRPVPGGDGDPVSDALPVPAPEAGPAPGPAPVLAPVPVTSPGSRAEMFPPPAPRRPSSAPPRPSVVVPCPPEGPAAGLLARLRLADPRLLLSAGDVARLAPAVDAWLARSATSEQITRTLTSGLPPEAVPVHHPAGFLEYRLAAHLPPPLPAEAQASLGPPPLVTCDGCERAFRSRDPDRRCADCRSGARPAARTVA